MRRIFVSVLLAAACASTALAGGCSGTKSSGAPDAGADSYGVMVTADAAGGDGGAQEAESSTMEQTTMRLANASPDLGPVDFCWRQTGAASFTGPVLEGDLPPLDAGPVSAEGGPPGSLAFGAMSPDVLLPSAGTFDIAVVAAGQTSCAKHRLAGTVTLDAGKRSTVVLMGVAGSDSGPDTLGVVAFTDALVDPQSARVRMIHAALGDPGEPATGPVSVRAGSEVIAAEIDPGKTAAASTTSAIDALGYATLAPLQGPTSLELATLGDAAPIAWATAETDLSVLTGTAHTGIIVTAGQGALAVSWCADTPSNRTGPTCSVLLAQP
jgi:hypothetical protein